MNSEDNAAKSQEPNLASAGNRPEEPLRPAQIEPFEFEKLLQRAMEVLSAKAASASSSCS